MLNIFVSIIVALPALVLTWYANTRDRDSFASPLAQCGGQDLEGAAEERHYKAFRTQRRLWIAVTMAAILQLLMQVIVYFRP